MQISFLDDHDLYLLMEKYHQQLKRRGMKIQPIKHISNGKQHQDSLPYELHHQMDQVAKQTRKT